MFKLSLKSLFVAATVGFLTLPAQSASMSTSEMVLVLRQAKVVAPTSRLDVLQSEQEVTVITKRSPKMNDDDCKIKAVLMAKALMDAQPKQLAAVKVLYTMDGDSSLSRVVVGAGDVQAFAGGTITEKQLLASLDLAKESGDGNDSGKSSVAAGAQKEKRVVLQSRIDALKQGGTGVAPFQKMFNDIEDLTKAGKTKEASLLIDDLSTKLASQESLRDQAKRVGEGRGVKGQQGTVTASNQQWRPATSAGSNTSSSARTGSQEFNSHAGWMFRKLDEMEGKGISVSDLRTKLRDLERQSTSAPQGEVCPKVEEVRLKMLQLEKNAR